MLERVTALEVPQRPVQLQDQRVLVLDAHATNEAIVRSYLEAWGIRCEAATSGAEGIARLRHALSVEPYRIVLVDDELPDMNVHTLASVLRELGMQQTRLVVMRHFDARQSAGGGSEASIAAHVAKPIKQSALLNALLDALHATSSEAGEQQPAVKDTPSEEHATECLSKDTRILLAEDNAINQKLALIQLRKLGYQAVAVSGGREAIDAVATGHYGLVLMDCQMPEVDGFTATGAIRQQEIITGTHIPIIALTANALEGDRETCLAAGMDDYVTKPITLAKLRHVLEQWSVVPSS